MKKLPFLLAMLIVTLIVLPAADRYIRPSVVDASFWHTLSERDQSMYLIGYLTANTVWAQAMQEANEIQKLDDTIAHVYRVLSPASSYQWPEIAMMLDAHAEDGLPLWQTIHTYANTVREQNKGDL